MIVENIAEYVREKGIQQKALADAVGVAPQTMSEIIKGNRKLGADEYADICRFLEVPYGRFIKDER